MFALPGEILFLLTNKHRNLSSDLHLTCWSHVSGCLPMARFQDSGSQTLLHIKITWRTFKNLEAQVAPISVNQNIWWVGAKHQCFLMIPQVIAMGSKVWKPLFHDISDSCCFPVDKLSE